MYMGKVPTSLLSIVFHLYLIEAVFADEQVRKAQEELYKRHLFYGDITGEVSPALTIAINGEPLPDSVVAYRSSDDPYIQLTSSATNAEQVALVTAGDDATSLIKEQPIPNRHSRIRRRRVQPHKETNPLVLAFHTVDHAIRLLVGDTQPKKKRAVASRL